MKKHFALFALLFAVLVSCKDDSTTSPTATYTKSKFFPESYMPLSVGNEWVYKCTVDNYCNDVGKTKTLKVITITTKLWYDKNGDTSSVPNTATFYDSVFLQNFCYLDRKGNLIIGTAERYEYPALRNDYFWLIRDDVDLPDYEKCDGVLNVPCDNYDNEIITSSGTFMDLSICGNSCEVSGDTILNIYYFSKGVGLVKYEHLTNSAVDLSWELTSLKVK